MLALTQDPVSSPKSSPILLAILHEAKDGETRVAMTPDVVKQWVEKGVNVVVETGAGAMASCTDESYKEAGATIAKTAKEATSKANILVALQMPSAEVLDLLPEGALVISFVWGLAHPERITEFTKRGLQALSMDAIPRTSRAQTMDALSSMSNIAGYKSVLIAASTLDRYLPMMMTAAGTVPPAKALIVGAGVAGLQAIATAKRLGAVVEAYDIRPVVKEQVQSLGAKFVVIPLEEEDTESTGGYAKELSDRNKEIQRETLAKHVAKSDIVITTALIPGRPAPKLIFEDMVEAMGEGAVIVDLAAEQGGNCVYTKANETVVEHGVKIVGPVNLPATLGYHASQLYAKNIHALLQLVIQEGAIHLDMSDDIIEAALITAEKPAESSAVSPATDTEKTSKTS